jgi:hypothetical protein
VKRRYCAGANGEQIDVTPLPWWLKHTVLRWKMFRWKVRNNRRVVLLRAEIKFWRNRPPV